MANGVSPPFPSRLCLTHARASLGVESGGDCAPSAAETETGTYCALSFRSIASFLLGVKYHNREHDRRSTSWHTEGKPPMREATRVSARCPSGHNTAPTGSFTYFRPHRYLCPGALPRTHLQRLSRSQSPGSLVAQWGGRGCPRNLFPSYSAGIQEAIGRWYHSTIAHLALSSLEAFASRQRPGDHPWRSSHAGGNLGVRP